MQVLRTLSAGHVDYAFSQPAEQVDPLLAIRQARILNRNHGMIEHGLTDFEVQLVVTQFQSALLVIPRDHASTVATKNATVKGQ